MVRLGLLIVRMGRSSREARVEENADTAYYSTSLNGCPRLISTRPMTSYLILLACMIKSSVEDSKDTSVRAL
uniref:Uncharacterized protein n=1 Tax=Angiostrongylus cantonensis TaxID=6313 RepID=A0A0K0CYA0_ANGCA